MPLRNVRQGSAPGPEPGPRSLADRRAAPPLEAFLPPLWRAVRGTACIPTWSLEEGQAVDPHNCECKQSSIRDRVAAVLSLASLQKGRPERATAQPKVTRDVPLATSVPSSS